MSCLVATAGFSSTLSLPTVMASFSSASSFSTGSIMRHGPHQGAQKSSTNGLELEVTVASKFASVTCVRSAMRRSPFGCRALDGALGVLVNVPQSLKSRRGSLRRRRDDLLEL